MACVDIQSGNADSEMEEGEIVDDVDYLSDISSEEEFLLRQRLKVLENYNNALERKEAKKTSIESGKEHGCKDALHGLSEISSADADDGFLKTTFVITKVKKHAKPHHKQKRSKPNDNKNERNKERRKKRDHNKKKADISCDSDASEFSDEDYKNKRRKLADAVSLNIVKNDTSTLKDRLTKMLGMSKNLNHKKEVSDPITEHINQSPDNKSNKDEIKELPKVICNASENLIDTCTEVSKLINNDDSSKDKVEALVVNKKEIIQICNSEGNSDEDLELLRQHALKTKSLKPKNKKTSILTRPINKTDTLSEDEDSDTEELRMICLKSRLLKKAIELKQKQKRQKRLSNSTNIHDFDIDKSGNNLHVDNNTDIESVDMEIGSDCDDRGKELINDCTRKDKIFSDEVKGVNNNSLRRVDELEEDEDLLRAKLLTSLSKNLPNLIDLKALDSALNEDETKNEKKKTVNQTNTVEEKKFIIELGDSDSEGENEATKNLTKMHMKLSEQAEFQQKLDLFLKSTRQEVEKTKLPDVVQNQHQKPPEKFIAKTMNHLPKSEQIEYKNLVKRMAELEKIKQARQNMINMNKRDDNLPKETLKPRNFSVTSNKIVSPSKIEEKIALSRKRIAEESSKMLKLKEEATKLTQRYKIVATELKNIATAITFNKKQQKTVHNGLAKIRNQHQMLLKSVPNMHSNFNFTISRTVEKTVPAVKLQKENEPLKEDRKNSIILKSVKVSVVNDLNKEVQSVSPRLSVEVDISNNKKVVRLPKSPQKDRVDCNKHCNSPKKDHIEQCVKEKIENKDLDWNQCPHSTEIHSYKHKADFDDDYKSPLDAFECKNWEEDPNAVLCPFEFGGSCRDPDCKYLHPKIPTQK